MSKSRKPDFISVSPHKTGTSWLYVMLKAHPQVWLPPKKELWFFNQLGGSYVQRWYNFFRRIGMPGDNRVSFEEDMRTRFRRTILSSENLAALWWWLKLLLLPYWHGTYHYLFPERFDLCCGDITPNYYYLKPEVIGQLSQYNPDARIILVLRHPVERVWSYTRMSISGSYQKPFEHISQTEFVRYFDQLHSWWRPYVDSIKIWETHFQRVYVGYYDTLRENPIRFYGHVCSFLEIDNSHRPANIQQVINRGRPEGLTPELRRYLSSQYLDEIRELAERGTSPYPRIWLRQMERDRAESQ